MDIGNSQGGDHHSNEEEDKKKKEDKMFAKLYDIFFPSDHQQQPSQQPLITTVADQILHPASPPMLEPTPTAVDVAAANLAEQRRQQEEEFKLRVIKSLEAQQQLLLWEYFYWQNWGQMQQAQQVNHLLQDPQQITSQPATHIRKKKKLEKRDMAYMVPGANIQAMDRWAWRKYGQKPIKGSTFPRSYYKCSTSRGCKAKKRVEKVLVEPEVYMVTYKGEHVHPNPVQLARLPDSVLASLPVCDLPNHLLLPPEPDQLPLLPHSEIPFQQLPLPEEQPPPPEMASLAAEEEEEEGLLIPNLMVDEDMMSSIEELKNYWKRYTDLGDGPSSSASGSGSSGPGFY